MLRIDEWWIHEIQVRRQNKEGYNYNFWNFGSWLYDKRREALEELDIFSILILQGYLLNTYYVSLLPWLMYPKRTRHELKSMPVFI